MSVATVKRDGTSTPSPVWFARVGEDLVFRTFERTLKARRLRRDHRVAVAPCDRAGRVLAPYRDGAAAVLCGEPARRADRLLTRRHGWRKPLADLLYRPRLGRRVVVRVTLDGALTSPATPSVVVTR